MAEPVGEKMYEVRVPITVTAEDRDQAIKYALDDLRDPDMEWDTFEVRQVAGPHVKVLHGRCEVCGHFGDDCEGVSDEASGVIPFCPDCGRAIVHGDECEMAPGEPVRLGNFERPIPESELARVREELDCWKAWAENADGAARHENELRLQAEARFRERDSAGTIDEIAVRYGVTRADVLAVAKDHNIRIDAGRVVGVSANRLVSWIERVAKGG